ncbi:MAG: asparagine synthetase B, partial [Acidobacteria bacterium]
MRDAMSHRGPDGAGIFISSDRRLALGHRRLAIIDLSERAAQPMSNEDDTLWVVFNGEIYNH